MQLCPFCGAKVVKWGKDALADGTIRQRYRCSDGCLEGKDIYEPLNVDEDGELLQYNDQLQRKVQRFSDTNRIERKAFRNNSRLSNALERLNEEFIDLLKQHGFSMPKEMPIVSSGDGYGVIHLADLHANELINLSINRYDFDILSKRLHKLAVNAKRMFNSYDVSTVLIAITGDVINSDRRLDEILSMATNRTKAQFLVVDLLKSFIIDIAHDYNVFITAVTGNESRVGKDYGTLELTATDNYDYSVFHILKVLFEAMEYKNVAFIGNCGQEEVVAIGGKTILVLHGYESIFNNNVEKAVIQLIGKYADRGIKIDFVIFGHLHCTRISDIFARSSSICGANAYSENGLHLVSRAAQNIHIITGTGDIHSVKVDIQNTQGYNGYPFDKALEAYNPRAVDKLKSSMYKVTKID